VSELFPNRAAARLHEQAAVWHRPEYLASEAADQLTDDFVREDRRRLVGVPGLVDGPTFIEQQWAWLELGHGPHSFHVDEVIGQRSDRWVVVRLRIAFEDDYAVEVLVVWQYDKAVVRLERMIVFDADDVDSALGELDRLSGGIA